MKLTKESIEEILNYYDLGTIITPFEKLDSGFQSDNALIVTTTGKYVIKSFIEESDKIQIAMKVCEFLSSQELKVPKAIRTKTNKLVLEYREEVIAIQTFIEGKPKIDEEDNPINLDEYLEFYGLETGRFHKASLTMVQELGTETFRVGRSGIDYTKFMATKYMPEDDYVKEQYKKWEEEINKLPEDILTEAVIHGDIGPHDFFFHNNEYTGLIDLNAAYTDYLLFDIAPSFMYCGLYNEDQEERVKVFLKAYFEESPIKLEELKWLPLILRTRWLIQIFYHQYRYQEGITQGSSTGEVEENLQGVRDGILFLKETNKLPIDYYYNLIINS